MVDLSKYTSPDIEVRSLMQYTQRDYIRTQTYSTYGLKGGFATTPPFDVGSQLGGI